MNMAPSRLSQAPREEIVSDPSPYTSRLLHISTPSINLNQAPISSSQNEVGCFYNLGIHEDSLPPPFPPSLCLDNPPVASSSLGVTTRSTTKYPSHSSKVLDYTSSSKSIESADQFKAPLNSSVV